MLVKLRRSYRWTFLMVACLFLGGIKYFTTHYEVVERLDIPEQLTPVEVRQIKPDAIPASAPCQKYIYDSSYVAVCTYNK